MELKPTADQMDSDLPELDNNINIKSELNRLISLANSDPSYTEWQTDILKVLLSNINYEDLINSLNLNKLFKSMHVETICENLNILNINPIEYLDNIDDIQKNKSFHMEFVNLILENYNSSVLYDEFEIVHKDDIEIYADIDEIIKNNGLIYEDDITEQYVLDMFDDLIHVDNAIYYINEDMAKEEFNLFSKDEILVYNPFTEGDISRAWE